MVDSKFYYENFRNLHKYIDTVLLKGIKDGDEYDFFGELAQFLKYDKGFKFKICYPYRSVSIERKISFIEGVNSQTEEGKTVQTIYNVFLTNGIHTQEYRQINSTIEKNGLFFAILLNYIENQVAFEDRSKYFTKALLKEDHKRCLIETLDILLDQEFQYNDLNSCHINFEGYRDQQTTFRQKFFEIKNIILQEKKTKEDILKNLEEYFLGVDNSQFLSIFIHVFLFCYLQLLFSSEGKFCHIKMKSLSDIYYYLLLIAFYDELKINFHCLQAISNYFNIKINYVDMNCNTPNFISIYPVFNNLINQESVLIPDSKLLTVNLATFQDKIYIFYSSSFCYEIKNLTRSDEGILLLLM
jgi:hypothetical protein